MRLRFEQDYPKTTTDRFGDHLQQMFKSDMAKQIGEEILKTTTLTASDPYPNVSATEFMAASVMPMPEVRYRAEFVHLPIEQWQHVKQMLRLLETTPQAAGIVQQIIGEIENK